jgi:L-aminopeptidase/D-esterase-like protein
LPAPGKLNALTDVEGILVGNFTDMAAVSGVTVILCPEGATGAVDVRGAAPGTRETDLLAPVNLVEKVQAVVLSGGSVYGLAAADGVVRWLAERGLGFPLGGRQVAPIVPAAVLYDLGRGAQFVPPVGPDWGRTGAGTGALAHGIKGGLGSASQVLDAGLTVAALMAVNSHGTVVNPTTGRPWEIGLELAGEFGDPGRRAVRLPPQPPGGPARNTTHGVVATDSLLTKTHAHKVAQMAHDGLARAIRPAHTMFDGDTVFCLATCRKPLPETAGVFSAAHAQAVNEIGHAAADCAARAIIRAILTARTMAGMVAFGDLERL